MLWQERYRAARNLDSSWDLASCPQKTGQFSVLWDSLDKIHKEVCHLPNLFLRVLVCIYIFSSIKYTVNRLISW